MALVPRRSGGGEWTTGRQLQSNHELGMVLRYPLQRPRPDRCVVHPAPVPLPTNPAVDENGHCRHDHPREAHQGRQERDAVQQQGDDGPRRRDRQSGQDDAGGQHAGSGCAAGGPRRGARLSPAHSALLTAMAGIGSLDGFSAGHAVRLAQADPDAVLALARWIQQSAVSVR